MNEQEKDQGHKPEHAGIFVVGMGGRKFEPYPAWRYHDFFEPVVVNDTEEDIKVKAEGWKEADQPITSVPKLMDWRIDLEDMNSKQLVLFIKDEFGVELPIDAKEEQLIKAVWRLMRVSPQHSGRVCLLAQTIEMDYDEEVEFIREAAEGIEMKFSKEIVI